jgi:hypothetical protein
MKYDYLIEVKKNGLLGTAVSATSGPAATAEAARALNSISFSEIWSNGADSLRQRFRQIRHLPLG